MTKQEWLDKCSHWKKKWSHHEQLPDDNGLDIYSVVDAISTYASDDAVILCDAGTAYFVVPQTFRFKGTQRLIMSQSQGDMGWALPAAIGVAKAGAKNVICIVVHSFTPQTHLSILSTAKNIFSSDVRVGLYPRAYAPVFTE